jgi:peptide deformylase
MKLVKENDPILKQVCKEFDFLNPPFDPIEFAKELVKTMYDLKGIGLSANQVGIDYRVFALRGSPENFVCYNPKIVLEEKEKSYLVEGCLTYPGLYVKIKRSDQIRVRFNTPNGDVRTETFRGLTAHAFQHELDHLNGVVFYTRANPFHREQALKRWRK